MTLPAPGRRRFITRTATGATIAATGALAAGSPASAATADTAGLYSYLKTVGGAINPAILDDLASGALTIDCSVATAAYYENGRQGGTTYIVVPAGTGTDNGGSFIDTGTHQLAAVFGTSCSPRQFGAIDGTDATTELQAFLDYVHTNHVDTAILEGVYNISAGLTWGVNGEPSQSLFFTGDLFLKATAPIDVMLDIADLGAAPVGGPIRHVGRIRVAGQGSTQYAARTCRIGIRISGSARASFGELLANNFWQNGVQVHHFTAGNTSATTISKVAGQNIGSGFNVAGGSATANWSNPVNSGTANSAGQRTVVTVDTDAPAIDDTEPLHAIIGDDVYQVVESAPGQLTLFPWINPDSGASGELKFLFGAAFAVVGKDAGVCGVDLVDAKRCGIGVAHMALYGPNIGRALTQYCGAGLAFGIRPSAASLTLNVQGLYCEGNVFDILRATGYGTVGIEINGYAINPAKCVSSAAPRTSTGEISLAVRNGFYGMQVNFGDGPLTSVKRGGNGAGSTILIDPTVESTNARHHQVYKRDTWKIDLAAPNFDYNRLFGFDSTLLTVVGTGSGNTPTGSMTFNPPEGWTVNGEPSVVFSGFTGPPTFVIMVDFADVTFRVSQIGAGLMLLVCKECSTAFAVGLDRCPHCGATDYHEQGTEMPKNTRSAGATNKYTEEPAPEPETAVRPTT